MYSCETFSALTIILSQSTTMLSRLWSLSQIKYIKVIKLAYID